MSGVNRRDIGRVIRFAEPLLIAEIAHKGIGNETQQAQRIKDAFALAEKFVAEAARREDIAEQTP